MTARLSLPVAAALLLGMLAAFTPQRALAVDAPDGRYEWGIWRGNKRLGTDVITLSHRNGELIVERETHIDDNLVFVSLYRYIHRAQEVWRNGSLARLTAFTNDNDNNSNLSAEMTAKGLLVEGVAGRFIAPPGVVPSSLWQIDMVKSPMLLDVVSGNLLAVHVVDGGEQPIATSKGDLRARHFSMSGDMARELWYGPDGILAQEEMSWSDGKPVLFRLVSKPPARQQTP